MWDDGKGNKRERLQDGPHSEYADHHYGFQTLYKQRSLKVTKINLLQWAGQKCNEVKLTKLQMDGREEAQKKAEHFFCD